MFHKVHVTRIVATVFAGSLISAAGPAISSTRPLAVTEQATTARPAVRDFASELSCGARAAFEVPKQTLRVTGGREKGKRLFGTGDALVIGGGTAQGIKVGQEYFLRRVVSDRFTAVASDNMQPISIHTSGWARVTDTQTNSAVVTVTHSCDGILEGDYLEPFGVPTVPPPAPIVGEPDYSNPGKVILGDERRQMGSAGTLMVFNRGSDHGLRAGQRLTIFREAAGGPVVQVGEGTVMVVGPETTTFRIDKSTDAIYVGDLIAIHR